MPSLNTDATKIVRKTTCAITAEFTVVKVVILLTLAN